MPARARYTSPYATGAEHVGNFIGAQTATAVQHRSRL